MYSYIPTFCILIIHTENVLITLGALHLRSILYIQYTTIQYTVYSASIIVCSVDKHTVSCTKLGTIIITMVRNLAVFIVQETKVQIQNIESRIPMSIFSYTLYKVPDMRITASHNSILTSN